MILTSSRENNNPKARDTAWSSALGKILLGKRIVSFETMRFSFANINGGDGVDSVFEDPECNEAELLGKARPYTATERLISQGN